MNFLPEPPPASFCEPLGEPFAHACAAEEALTLLSLSVAFKGCFSSFASVLGYSLPFKSTLATAITRARAATTAEVTVRKFNKDSHHGVTCIILVLTVMPFIAALWS